MEIDFQMLGERLTAAGLTGRPVDQYSKKEVELLVATCIDALQPSLQTEFVTAPYIDGQGRLHIPFDSDPKYHYWKGCGQSLLETLRELKATDEVVRKYVKIEDSVPF